jgi:hypothetical protein
MQDSELVPLLGVDEGHFCGVIPNVGDTYAKWGMHDIYRFYSVQRRYFIDSPDADSGWCVVVREIETAPQLENVVKAWAEDTQFWNDIDDQERQEDHEHQQAEMNALIAKADGELKPRTVAKTKKPRKKVLKPRTPKNDSPPGAGG